MPSPHYFCTLLVLVLGASSTAPVKAQDIAAPSQTVVRYHYGDDADGLLGWARTDFDDSSWPVAPQGNVPVPPFASDGFLWIRTRITVPAVVAPLALQSRASRSGPDVQELFVNGVRIGQYGQFPPHSGPMLIPEGLVFDLPAGLVRAGEPATIVLRGWTMPFHRMPARHITADFTIDHAVLLHALSGKLYAESLLRYMPEFAADLLLEVLGLGVLLFGFWSGRRELRLYGLWLVIMPIFLGFISLGGVAVGLNLRRFELLFTLVNALGMVVVVEFIWTVQQFRDRVFRTLAHLCWIIDNAATLASVVLPSGSLVAAALSVDVWALFTFNVITLGADLWALFVTRRNRAIAAAMALINVGYFLRFSGHPMRIGGLPISFFEAAFFLSSFVITFVLLRQSWAAWKKSNQLHIEFAAARELQRQLVPLALPEIPGLRMQAAYLPANDVGGDFYQVLQQPDGTMLLLVGDVSGKGLKAAMTGALTIGAACALAAEAPGPAALLERLNREMTRFHKDGFVTCVCLRIAHNGIATIASAGHPAPYRNGEEILLSGGFPLGLIAGANYAETTLTLAPGDTLTFLTDGVVEARNAAGELFGFERTAAISTQSAGNIAAAAQAFGQDDDITVLTVTLAGAGQV